MNCRDFEKNILLFVRHEPIGTETVEQILAHCNDCRNCARRLEAEKALLAGFRPVIDDIRDKQAPARVRADLLAAFHAQHKLKEVPAAKNVRVFSRRRRIGMVFTAAAACLLIALLAGVIEMGPIVNRQQPEILQAADEADRISETTDTPAPITVSGKRPIISQPAFARKPKPALTATNRISRPKPQSTVKSSTTLQNVEEARFYPLGGADELVPLESGQVVRVSVAVSSLIALGVPLRKGVNTGNPSQSVQADLLFGQDGIARAIRLLD